MTRKFVRVLCDVHCDWEGLPPVYRVYVNDELFAERTYSWTDHYLEELLQIEAETGLYSINYQLVAPHLAKLNVANMRVDFGPGEIENNQLRIKDESQ